MYRYAVLEVFGVVLTLPRQDRVTDHRIGFTTMNLQNVMDGERLESIIEALRKQHEVETIQELLEDADNEGPS